MDDQSLRNVLAILRLVHDHHSGRSGKSMTVMQFIKVLAGDDAPGTIRLEPADPIDAAAVARVAAYLLDQFSQAGVVIENSQLVEEAKAGVRGALRALESAFAIGNLHNQLDSLAQSAAGYISNLVILLSAAGLPIKQQTPEEAIDLAAEIDDLSKLFNDPEIDPVVRDVARRHLEILATLIRHISIFGMEPALQSYFELLMKMRRADAATTPEAKSKLDPLMARIKSWGERLQTIDGIINTGANLLDRAGKAAPLLHYLPPM